MIHIYILDKYFPVRMEILQRHRLRLMESQPGVRMKSWIVFVLIFIVLACGKSNLHLETATMGRTYGTVKYTIPGGSHQANNNIFKSIRKASLEFVAIFDSTCIYKNRLAENELDLNKLYGFSDCGSHHHQNSARFAWRWNGQAIEIHAYCYVNGKRQHARLGLLNIGEEGRFQIETEEQGYRFTFNGSARLVPRACTTAGIDGYQLYPYFGGDETAPHDMHILIREISTD